VDWRAPVARLYYQSSAHDRLDVARRRRFGFRASTLTGFEDEDLRVGQDFVSDVLTTEIERPRTGPMRDIVATIQREQDVLIRRGPETSLCVQGAPGTGKTAVGLHRAAWLLYTFPRLARADCSSSDRTKAFSATSPASCRRSVRAPCARPPSTA
jgi:DNA helicase IV